MTEFMEIANENYCRTQAEEKEVLRRQEEAFPIWGWPIAIGFVIGVFTIIYNLPY